MKLKKVEINGFRSIEEMEIEFENGCGHKILVGKNESGKSNILKALSLLSGEAQITAQDRKELYNDEPFVRFQFNLEQSEIEECRKLFYEKFIPNEKEQITKELSIESFFEKHGKHILYKLEYGNDGTWKYWALDKNIKFEDSWYIVHTPLVVRGEKKKFSKGLYVNGSFLNKFEPTRKEKIMRYLSKVESIEKIHADLRKIVSQVSAPGDYTFPLIDWKYDSKEHDLPPSIRRAGFAQNPDICIPLKNMFLLSGYKKDEIGKAIRESHEKGVNSLDNLLIQVGLKANQTIQKAWKEFKKVSIDLRSSGNHISIGIKDSDSTNRFDFHKRSDGFRRLVSFLLLIDENVHKTKADNPIILIDEPETGLHPSSAKDLRNRLIESGKEYLIVYATHSISMIDTENIENNLIVTKTKENTTYEPAKEDGTSPAENVYRAIGYSIYEELKQKSILMEGYSDKKVLSFFMKGDQWKDCSICRTDGISNIKNVISIIDLVDREVFSSQMPINLL